MKWVLDMLEQFIFNHQFLTYLIVFGGMFIEGELFFLIASIFAWGGYLNFWWLLAATFVGLVLGDLAWYYLGRYSKDTKLGIWINKRISQHTEWFRHNLASHYWSLALCSKFLYYVNRLVPLLAGWIRMEPKRFFKIHVNVSLVWLLTMIVVSYFLQFVVEAIGLPTVLKRFEWFVLSMTIIFIGGEYLLKILFLKKIKP